MSLSKIFIINPTGEVHHYESLQHKKNYHIIAEMCDQIFPPILRYNIPLAQEVRRNSGRSIEADQTGRPGA